MPRPRFWQIFLAAFLVLWGIFAITNIEVVLGNVVAGICAIIAAVCLLLDR